MNEKIDIINEEIQKLLSYNFEEKEPEFDSIKSEKSSLIIWRIDNLKLERIPEGNIGIFRDGYSYLILNIKSPEDKYAHIWEGRKSSKEIISFASYKILQLDNYLENNLIILYESQGNESPLFKSYFEFLTILKSGEKEKFYSPDSQQYKARLFHVHSEGAHIQSREISINKKYIDSDDVYLLDTGVKVFIFIGKGSNSFEKFHLTVMVKRLEELRQNKSIILTIDECCPLNENDLKIKKEFEEFLVKFEENIEENEEKSEVIDKTFKKMMKLSDEKGKLEISEIEYNKNNLSTNDAFLIDRGDAIIIWIGKNASKGEKKFSRFYAKKYINKEKRNKHLPIIITNEGKLSSELDKCFI